MPKFAGIDISGLPVGKIFSLGSDTQLPFGTFVCDGSAISRSVYSKLFAAIGTAWGSGNGSSTFNLPDLRGRTLLGSGTGPGLSARSSGQILGEENHQLSAVEMPVHAHSGSTNVDGAHNHVSPPNLNSAFQGGPTQTAISDVHLPTSVTIVVTANGSDHSHGFSTNNAGGGQGHNIMQPSAVARYAIAYI